ncbi:hypothetical protein [Streptomyces sp. NPDC055243]|uniref:hypothetical protein n=1 Tax=Streptomyces sp. NPDC055243 TaxID=3365720 RepID=UPI0037CF943A
MRKPRWSVTWPTRPSGLLTVYVRADDPTDAVRIAAQLEWPTEPGWRMAFDYTPEVWRLRRPYWRRARYSAGPHYPDRERGAVVFRPEPLVET